MTTQPANSEASLDTGPGPTASTRVPWGAVAVFVLLAYGLAWLVALPLWIQGLDSIWGKVLPAVMMVTPALATLVVVFLLHSPRRQRARTLGLWPLPPAGRTIVLCVAAIFGPILLMLLGTLLAGALGWIALDLRDFSLFASSVLGALPPEAAAGLPPLWILVVAQIAAIPLNALVVSVLAFGEELGWRGWLLPTLRPLGTWPALLLTGLIWGLWHAPLTLLGHNFGLTDYRGVLLMCGFCISVGILLGWLRLRSGSVWPAVLAHGALNAAVGIPMYLGDVEAPPSMLVVGPGVLTWALCLVLAGILAACGQFRTQPELPRKQPASPRGTPEND